MAVEPGPEDPVPEPVVLEQGHGHRSGDREGAPQHRCRPVAVARHAPAGHGHPHRPEQRWQPDRGARPHRQQGDQVVLHAGSGSGPRLPARPLGELRREARGHAELQRVQRVPVRPQRAGHGQAVLRRVPGRDVDDQRRQAGLRRQPPRPHHPVPVGGTTRPARRPTARSWTRYSIDLRQNYDKISGKSTGPYALSPIQLPISPDDSYMLVVGTFTGNVLQIDMKTNKIVKSFDGCGPGCHGINFGAKKGGGYLGYVSVKFNNLFWVIDGDPNSDGDLSDSRMTRRRDHQRLRPPRSTTTPRRPTSVRAARVSGPIPTSTTAGSRSCPPSGRTS